MLFARAKKGAKGKAATKIVMKPNWITKRVGGAINPMQKISNCYNRVYT